MVDAVANRNIFQTPDIESIHIGIRACLVVGVDAAVACGFVPSLNLNSAYLLDHSHPFRIIDEALEKPDCGAPFC